MLRIIAALLVLGVLVFIHELGHFIVARLMGVRVNEFAIGMGPRLLKWGKGETVYSIRLLPFGGFCAMEGEDEEAPTPAAMGGNADREPPEASADTSRSFAHKPVWCRVLIVVAGAVMNLVLGYVLLLVYNGALQPPYDDKGTVLFPTTTIARLEEDTPAYQSGLRPGDTIVEVNGRRILMDTDLTMEMQNDADGVLAMVVRRPTEEGSEKVTLPAVKFQQVTDEESGRQYLKYDFALLGKVRTFGNTFVQSARQELSIATVVWRTLVDMIQGDYGLNDLSGPVGTVDIIADAVGSVNSLEGWQTLVMLMVMITVNLGVFNLLPLPALDGGRLVFLVVEGITRKKVPAKFEGLVHFVGLLLLLLLMLVVTYSDITKFFI
ncbi:MAG: site-2 protease family protein [Clostridia bacterium]|nr:site-2 protease family protein [Clostridia bacterium]